MEEEDFHYVDLDDMACCGVKEIDGIAGSKNPEAVLRAICRETRWNYSKVKTNFPAFFVFTAAAKGRKPAYGDQLAKYIRKHDLGRVQVSETRKNPNSGSRLTVYLWAPAHRKMMKLKAKYEQQEKERQEKENASNHYGI